MTAAGADAPASGRGRARRWLGLGLAVLAAIAVLTALIAPLARDLTRLRSEMHDTLRYQFPQLEVDALRLANELASAGEVGDLADLRLAYDILYNRIRVIQEGRIYSDLRARPEIERELRELNRFLRETSRWIDGPDPDLIRVLPDLRAMTAAAVGHARGLSRQAISAFAVASESRQQAFDRALGVAGLSASLLIVLLAIGVAVLIGLFSLSVRRRDDAEFARQRLGTAIAAAHDAIVIFDEQERITEINPAAARTFGHDREAALGARFADLMLPADRRGRFRDDLRAFIVGGQSRVVDAGVMEAALLRQDGQEIPAEMSVASAHDRGGPIFIAYISDVSARLEQERKLVSARDRALASEQAKTEFVAIASHEMRTPLNGLIGMLDLLRDAPLEGRHADYLGHAAASAEILRRHVDDVLDLARGEAGGFALETRSLDLMDCVDEVIALNEPAAAAKGLSLVKQADGDWPALTGDPHRIRQILMNFIANAVKFAPSGNVVVSLRALERRADNCLIEIAVADEGPGIAAADQDRIFTEYVSLAGGGAGLGLAISRRIVEAMGGGIGVNSDTGAGSRFWARFPLAYAAEDRLEPAAEAKRSRPLRVLHVEDNRVNRLVIAEALSRAGHTVVEAEDGLAGVAAAESEAFDLILMDIGLPGLDGAAAARAIRDGDGLSNSAPIVALTAHAMAEEEAAFRQAGMTDCLIKPIRQAVLLKLVDDVAAGRQATGAAEASPPSDPIDEAVFAEFAAILPEAEMRALIAGFRLEAQKLAAAIAEAAPLAELAHRAHDLSGAAGLLGARAAKTALADLETACKRGDEAGARAAGAAAAERLGEAAAVLGDYAA